MKCKDCEYLVKVKSIEATDLYDIRCAKYGIYHYPISEYGLEILNCVEDQKNFAEVVRGEA